MVKIFTNTYLYDNGVWDMAQMLMYASTTNWGDRYDDILKKYVPTTYDCLILDFNNPYDSEDIEEFSYYIEPREGYYTEEDIKTWEGNQIIKFPPIHVSSIKLTKKEDTGIIEIESDNDYEVRKLFYIFSDLGNGGHSFGGLVKIHEGKGNIGNFGFDGDGSDYIEQIDNDNNLKF